MNKLLTSLILFPLFFLWFAGEVNAYTTTQGPFQIDYQINNGNGVEYTEYGVNGEYHLPVEICLIDAPNEHSPLSLYGILGGEMKYKQADDDIYLTGIKYWSGESWGNIQPGQKLYKGNCITIDFQAYRILSLSYQEVDFIPELNIHGNKISLSELAWWKQPPYNYRYEHLNTSEILSIPFTPNDNRTIGGDQWTLYDSTCTGTRYTYSVVPGPGIGPTGHMVIANGTTQCNYENTSRPGEGISGSNNPTSIYSSTVAAWYHFDDGCTASNCANESSANNNDAINSGAEETTGKNGGALLLKGGEGDYLNVSDDPSLDIRNTVSINAWVKLDLLGEDYSVVVAQDGGYGMRIQSTNQLRFSVVGVDSRDSTGTIPDTNWHMLTVTYDKDEGTTHEVHHYLDAVEIGTGNIALDMGLNTGLLIGAQILGFGHINGTIDEVSIWNETLSLSKIQMLYWNSISNFTTFGSEEINQPPILISATANATTTTNTTIVIYANYTDPEGSSLTYFLHWNDSIVPINISSDVTSGTEIQLSYTHNSPVSLNNWTLNVSDGIVNTTLTRTMTILYDPDDCTITANNFQIFTFKLIDEEEITQNLTGFIGVILTLNHEGTETEFSISNASTEELNICVIEYYNGDTIDVDVTFHSGANWQLASWYIRNHTINSSTTIQELSLINTTTGVTSHIYISDGTGVQAEGYYITILKYNYSSSTWMPLRMATTDNVGKAILNLRRNDRFYSFYIYNENLEYLQTFSNRIITSLETTLQLDLTIDEHQTDALLNIVHYCTNTTTSLSCYMGDNNVPPGVTETVLRAWRYGAVNSTLECVATSTDNPTTVSCDLVEGELYYYLLKVEMDGKPYIYLEGGFIGSEPRDDWGAVGILIVALLSLALAFVGAYDPAMFAILFFLGFAAGGVMGLVDPTQGMTYSFLMSLTATVIWRLKKK